MLVNNFHNEGASFLFQPAENKIILTSIDLQIENKKYIFPEKLTCLMVQIRNGKPALCYSEVRAEPVIAHLKKNFKHLTELY